MEYASPFELKEQSSTPVMRVPATPRHTGARCGITCVKCVKPKQKTRTCAVVLVHGCSAPSATGKVLLTCETFMS